MPECSRREGRKPTAPASHTRQRWRGAQRLRHSPARERPSVRSWPSPSRSRHHEASLLRVSRQGRARAPQCSATRRPRPVSSTRDTGKTDPSRRPTHLHGSHVAAASARRGSDPTIRAVARRSENPRRSPSCAAASGSSHPPAAVAGCGGRPRSARSSGARSPCKESRWTAGTDGPFGLLHARLHARRNRAVDSGTGTRDPFRPRPLPRGDRDRRARPRAPRAPPFDG